MKFLSTAAICAVLALAGCGDSDTDARDDGDKGPGARSETGANRFLDHIDADSAYAYANLERLPEEVVDTVWAINDASAQGNEAIFDALAEDEDVSDQIRVLIEEVKMLSTREGWEAAGLHSNPYYAFYGVDLLPFAQIELADGDAFAELLARVEAAIEQPLERRDIEGVEVLWFTLAEGFGIALRHDQDSVTAALIPDDAALLTRVAGQFEPADAMGDDALEAFNREIGLTHYGSGFVDWRRVINTVLTDENRLGRLLHDDESFSAIAENPACVAEYQAVTDALPRLVFGYTRLTDDKFDFMVRQETSAELAAGLAPIAQAPVSIDRELSGLFNFGLAFDLVAGREFARSLVDGWVENPPECPSFSTIAAQAPQLQEYLRRPLPPVVTNLNGLFLEAESLELADNGMPTGGGTLSFFMRNPQLLVGMAQMFSPAVAELQLEPGGEPQPVPEGAIPQLQAANLKAWLAMGENAIGIAVGEDNVDALTRAIEKTSADDLLMAGRLDFQTLAVLVDMAENALGDLENEEAAMGLAAQRQQYEAFAEIYDQASFKLRLGEKGIDFVGETTLK